MTRRLHCPLVVGCQNWFRSVGSFCQGGFFLFIKKQNIFLPEVQTLTPLSNHAFLYPPTATKGKVLLLLSLCVFVMSSYFFASVLFHFIRLMASFFLFQLLVHLYDFFEEEEEEVLLM